MDLGNETLKEKVMFDAGAVAQWVATGVIFIGMLGAWKRNGKSASQDYGALNEKVSHIKDQLSDPANGLSAIKKSVDEQRLNCAEISTSYGGRIDSLEKKPARRRKPI